MTRGSDILVRIGAAIFAIVVMRDAYAALRGHRLLITRGYDTRIFEGWKSRVAGAFLVLVAFALALIAWFGL
jgi:hypothetical protein